MSESDFAENRGRRTPAAQPQPQSGWAAWYAGRAASDRDRTVQSAPPVAPKAPERPAPPARAPVVRARRVRVSGGAQLLVVERCPFCGEKHVHGAVGPNVGDGDGPRVAHCFDSGLRRSYVLREVRAAQDNTEAKL